MTDEATIRRVLELPGTWAVVGWSPRADRPSHEVAAYLEQVGYPVVRVNPNVDPKTHPYISTGLKGNKFGVAHEDAVKIYQHAASLPGLKVVGIDCHIGSQITEVTPYLDAMDRVLDLVAGIEADGTVLEHIDFGGGLGINYHGETPPAADALWQLLLGMLLLLIPALAVAEVLALAVAERQALSRTASSQARLQS